MQFKALAFLSILSILFFTGCDSKDKSDDNSIEKTQKVERKSEFQLKTSSGASVNVKLDNEKIIVQEHSGKIVLLNFFATWCPPCIEGIPMLKEIREKYKNDFEIVSVLFEKDKPKEEILEFIKKYQIEYPITVGEENFKLAKQLGDVKKIPEMFLFTKEGRFVKRFVGKTSKEDLEQYINLAIKN